jgi:hypothetical protein
MRFSILWMRQPLDPGRRRLDSPVMDKSAREAPPPNGFAIRSSQSTIRKHAPPNSHDLQISQVHPFATETTTHKHSAASPLVGSCSQVCCLSCLEPHQFGWSTIVLRLGTAQSDYTATRSATAVQASFVAWQWPSTRGGCLAVDSLVGLTNAGNSTGSDPDK